MGQRAVQFSEQEFYHVYNRGTDKRTIFLDESDYKRFKDLLFLCNSEGSVDVRAIYREYNYVYEYKRGNQLVAIGAYCLMPNHFHILLTPVVPGGISLFMNKLGTSYSMYFNKKNERSGALFQGRFKAEMASDDVYLKYLFSYIHLNPIKLIQSDWKEKGINDSEKSYDYVVNYPYSSLGDYVNDRKEGVILDKAKFPTYFLNSNEQRAELFDWITFAKAGPL